MDIKPIQHPAAWTAIELPPKQELSISIDERHVLEFDRALIKAREAGASLETLASHDFPLGNIAEEVADWRTRLVTGVGLVLLRNFPIERYSIQDLEMIYLGLGCHLGLPVSQSNLGDRVGHVINIGGDDRRERAYRNSRELSLHTDRCDYIGMLCLRPSRTGGVSGYASAIAVHNRILATRPELLGPLYEGYRLHRFGEQLPGESPVTDHPVPVFSFSDGWPNVVYIRGYIDLAVDEKHYELSDLQLEALDYFDELAHSEEFCFDTVLEPGELAFTNNCLLLHRRTAFEDYKEEAKRRHLLRLWLVDPSRPIAEAANRHKNIHGIEKINGGGTYYGGPGYTSPSETRY